MQPRWILFLAWCVAGAQAFGDASMENSTGLDTRSGSGKTDLMAAAREADNNRIEALIKQGSDVNRVNGNGGTPIMYGALSGSPETVSLLLQYDANVDAVAGNGWTALMIASVKGYLDVARLLLRHGADPNLADVYSWTPLMRAVYEERLRVVRLLAAHRATRINQRGENGITALHLAVLKGNAGSVSTLLAHGADPGIKDDSGRTALDFARKNKDLKLVRMMSPGAVN